MYCINCGVKLSKSEKACPLCGFKLNNYQQVKPVYSDEIENFKKINYAYLTKIIVFIFLIAGLITFLCDLLISKHLSWSLYVNSAILYVAMQLPVFLNKNIYISLFVELVSLELLLFFIAFFSGGLGWYIYLVMPFIFVFWSYIFIFVLFMKMKTLSILRRFSMALSLSSITLLLIESCIDLYLDKEVTFTWSLYAIIPIMTVCLILFIISLNRSLVEEIKQRIFI